MVTQAQCYDFAEANGFTISDWGCTVQIEYPKRKRDFDVHERVLNFDDGRKYTWRLTMQEMKTMLSEMRDCIEADCEWCNS